MILTKSVSNEADVKNNKGFTLIELMIVVAIIAILTSIAYPSYLEHIKKSRRSDAQSSLNEFASAMERFYTINGSYAGADVNQTKPATNTMQLPHADVYKNRSPDSGAKYYDLKVKIAIVGNDFIVYAIAVGAQADDGDLSQASNGERKWDKSADNSWAAIW